MRKPYSLATVFPKGFLLHNKEAPQVLIPANYHQGLTSAAYICWWLHNGSQTLHRSDQKHSAQEVTVPPINHTGSDWHPSITQEVTVPPTNHTESDCHLSTAQEVTVAHHKEVNTPPTTQEVNTLPTTQEVNVPPTEETTHAQLSCHQQGGE